MKRSKRIAMTFFPDQFAKKLKTETLTLQELADRVTSTTARKKGNLPYVKLAAFNGKVNPAEPDKGCLRYNAGVVEITGIEGDKDDAPLGFDEAADKLKDAGLPALLYTSASHTDEKPRFRVICPTSCPLPPSEYKKLMARLNGVLGGALSGESFTLSQSYFFGAVTGSSPPRTRIINGGGRYIDERDDLDAGAIGKGQKPPLGREVSKSLENSLSRATKAKNLKFYGDNRWSNFAAEQSKAPIDVDQLLADMWHHDGHGNIRNTQLSVVAALLCRGVSADEAIATVLERTMEVTKETRATQIKRLQGMVDSWLRKHPELVPNEQPKKPLLWFYEPKDPHKIPLRPWLHAKHYIRNHVVMTSAPGDFGKTSLLLCNAVEMAIDKGLLGPDPVAGPYRVAYWNAEDPDDEIDRRVAAICLHHGIDQKKLKNQLIIGGMLPMGARLAWVEKGDVKFDDELFERVEAHIKEFEIDVLICDPLISFHSLPENETAMEKLIKQGFGQIAVKYNCCIELAHHMRKSPAGQYGGELSGDDSRGSSTIKDALRSMRVLNRMSKDEASVADIPDEQRRVYLRVDRGKGNMLPPQKATWFHLESVNLGNGVTLENGVYQPADEVQVAETWCYPEVLDAVKPTDIEWLLDEIGKGDYRLNTQAKDWVGYLLISRLKLDPNDDAAKKRIAAVIKILLKKGVLGTEPRKDKNSVVRDFVVPGKMPEKDAEMGVITSTQKVMER